MQHAVRKLVNRRRPAHNRLRCREPGLSPTSVAEADELARALARIQLAESHGPGRLGDGLEPVGDVADLQDDAR